MNQSIIEYVKPDKHTEYMACAQYANWVPASFNRRTNDAFIVQEIRLEKEVDEKKTVLHYYEAWHVENGICEKDPGQVSDDLFCIGHPCDDGDALKESIGHKGRVAFIPRVFFVEKEDSLYSKIQSWAQKSVREANGLRACYYTEKLSLEINKYQEYDRKPFYHEWDLTVPDKVFKSVLNYCKAMFHSNSKTDRRNFYSTIDDFFSNNAYPQIRQSVIDAWEDKRPLL